MQSESREGKREEIKRYLIAVFGDPTTHDHEKQIEAHVECAEMWGDYYAHRENARLIQLLTDIRFALGDDSRRMQDELVEYCKEIIAERGRLREWVKGLTKADWRGGEVRNRGENGYALFDCSGSLIEHYPTPLEAVEAYLNSNSGVEE